MVIKKTYVFKSTEVSVHCENVPLYKPLFFKTNETEV